ncbi:glycosyltransferase [Pedobacter aquatilis]|uniref:glycosyltransferase n=1 Tax=Pedobacter aquatilis TaxID=351343 RepID=UPI00292DDC10|nr:glycosyltransferase [Pedobacter aquatilis]
MKTAVVLISYNQENFITDALEGIRLQTVTPDEVIIADDCSKDQTQQIIENYVQKYQLQEKWTLLFNKTNKGINLNLQNGIDHTSSEILIVMSGDDISLPNRIEVALELFKQYPNLHIVSTSIDKIDENRNIVGELSYMNEIIDDAKKVIKAGMPNVFPVGQNWRRSIFDKFGKLPHTVPNEDDQITFRAIIDGGIFCSSQKTILYRVHSKSASSWLRNNQSDAEYFIRFTADMDVRKKHMELWINALSAINRPDRQSLIKLVEKKISLYSMLGKLEDYPIVKRISYLFTHFNATGAREKFYIVFGKTGVLYWRKLKRLLGR